MDRPRFTGVFAYGAALLLGVAAVVPFVERDGRFILEPDTPFGDIKLYYDTWRSGAWAALPPPDPNVYFEGHSLIYGLILHLYELLRGPFAVPFDQAVVVAISMVNAVAHVAATVVIFATLRRLAGHAGIALALTALFALSPQILDIDMVRIDRLMILPLVVILHLSICMVQGQSDGRHGAWLGAALAVMTATKISGFAFGVFPATAVIIALAIFRKDRIVRRRLGATVVVALLVGLPLLAVLMIRFALYPNNFIAGLEAGYMQQMSWTAIFPFTPRLYYNVDLFAGYGGLFLVLVSAAVIAVAVHAGRRRDPVSIWLVVNLALFSVLGVAAFKYSRGGYHLVPLYLYALAIAARLLAEAFPRRPGSRVGAASAAVLLLLLVPLGATALAYSKAASIAWRRPESIARTRFAARDWIVAHFPVGARICMMGSSQWAGPQLAGLGFHVTTRIFDFPYLSRATMADFVPPRLDQMQAACDGVVFNDLHKAAYVGNFQTFGLKERFDQWQQMFHDLEQAFPPAVFAAETPAYYVSRVEVYDLRRDPAPGAAAILRASVGAAVEGETLRVGERLLPVAAGAVTGNVDAAVRHGDNIAIDGWAIDIADQQPAVGIMVAAGDKIIGFDGTGTARRPDVGAAFNAPEAQAAGFSTCLSSAWVAAGATIRVFAITADGMVGALGGGQGIPVKDAVPDAALPDACRSAE